MRLSSSQDVSLIQRVLITLMLRRMINNGFSVGPSITCSESQANRVHSQCQYSRFLHSHRVCSQGHPLDRNQPRPCGVHAAAKKKSLRRPVSRHPYPSTQRSFTPRPFTVCLFVFTGSSTRSRSTTTLRRSHSSWGCCCSSLW